MKYLLIFLLPFTSTISFAESYDSVNSIGNKIEEGRFKNVKYVSVFGSNSDVDAAEDIWEGGGDYTGFPSGAAETFEVFSSDVVDTAAGTGARTIRLFYLDGNKNCFDSNEEFLFEDVTLNGTTGVNTTATGVRLWKAIILTSGSGLTNAGTITIRHTTTTANIFAVMPIGAGQTRLSFFTICNGYSAFFESILASMADNTANTSTLGLVSKADNGNEIITRTTIISTQFSATSNRLFNIGIVEKTDIKIRATTIQNVNGMIHVGYRLRLVKQ